MELHDWLVRSHFLKYSEYQKLVEAQVDGTYSRAILDKDGFLANSFTTINDLAVLRKHPIGDVLRHMPFVNDVYARAAVSDLDELVVQWQLWHVLNCEPIANYSTTSRFGKNIYCQQTEKRLVARRLCQYNRPRGGTIIRNGDTVVIPEGSSAFYCALAVGGLRTNVSIITSNGPLYREYLDNPSLANAFTDFHVIGGLADIDRNLRRSEHAGVYGPDAEVAYKHAINENPRATVVVLPISGILPEDGPFAHDGRIRALKREIILDSIEHEVRELVFIGDYTKHLRSRSQEYGVPIFNSAKWSAILKKNSVRISLVTAPPPALCRAIQNRNDRVNVPIRDLTLFEEKDEFEKIDFEYNEAARQLAPKFYSDGASMFHEAYDADTQMKTPENVAELQPAST